MWAYFIELASPRQQFCNKPYIRDPVTAPIFYRLDNHSGQPKQSWKISETTMLAEMGRGNHRLRSFPFKSPHPICKLVRFDGERCTFWGIFFYNLKRPVATISRTIGNTICSQRTDLRPQNGFLHSIQESAALSC